MGKHVLLTGVTGFVGKVVLAEMLRRQRELDIDVISVLVRPRPERDGRVQTPEDRFNRSVVRSEVFRSAPADWRKKVQVVSADLEQDRCGIEPAVLADLHARVTHVIHCAASVDFDLPVRVAASANIDSALNVLELARGCTQLVTMVDVSTAYVTAWHDGPIFERLAHLPRDASELHRCINDGSRTEQELLGESGHPNTYTYTKCIAEHLLSERRGHVPLVIVRPSIISAAFRDPFPGWIDSAAAFAGCLMFSGLGLVKAWNAHPDVRLDVVPVDVVSSVILKAAFVAPKPLPGQLVPIHLATMGLSRAMRADLSAQTTVQFFRERPGAKQLPSVFIGQKRHGFDREDLVRRALPMSALRGYYALTQKDQKKKRVEKLDDKLRYMNAAFGYFTNHTFDFRPAEPPELPGFTPHGYIDIVNRGMYRHLLNNDETRMPLAGRSHNDARDDLRWAAEKPDGSLTIRAFGLSLRKTLRRCASSVTFDRPSFERAAAKTSPDTLFVLAPSHRSYLDFLLTSYLCFQHPEFGIPMPHIAAAEEFSKIPLVGQILRKSKAFFIRRGVGRATPEIGAELNRVVEDDGSLMFFIEGQRSRSRRTLPPKRGLLRALQATDRNFTVIPIAISYERLPEEDAFERELAGGARSRTALTPLLRWLSELAKNRIELGNIHLACGTPVEMDQHSDVPTVARQIVAEQQRSMVVTSFHLRAFLSGVDLPDIDEAWLTQAIEKRGGRVLSSNTSLTAECSFSMRQSLCNQWMHWFYPDALRYFPQDSAVRHHIAQHGWAEPKAARGEHDPRTEQLVRALFRTVQDDYALVAKHISEFPPAAPKDPIVIAKQNPQAYLPHIQDALGLLENAVGSGSLGSNGWALPETNGVRMSRGGVA